MSQKIIHFIVSRSEHTRKIIAGAGVGLAGIVIFFAWSAGVSARLPLLGSEFDPSASLANTQDSGQIAAPNASVADSEQSRTISPIKGLIQSFQGLAKLFHGDYSAAAVTAPSPASTTPINSLFNKMSDEKATSSEQTTTTPENVPPIEDLPAL